jgi:hypothetical protein
VFVGHRPFYRRPVIVGAPLFVGAGVIATRPAWGGNCRRILRYTAFGEPFWTTRCCRVVVRYDAYGTPFRARVCRRVA